MGSIKQFYKKTPFFKEYYNGIEECISSEQTLLAPFLNEITQHLFEILSIKTKVIYSSSIPGITSHKDDLIVDLCCSVGATRYISGPFGRDYLDSSKFQKNNIELLFHDYKHPDYKQQFEGFISNLSILDLLFNYGTNSLQILNTTKFSN